MGMGAGEWLRAVWIRRRKEKGKMIRRKGNGWTEQVGEKRR